MKRKSVNVLISLVLIIMTMTSVYAASDETALIDPVSKSYTGRTESKDLMRNLDFKDLSGDIKETAVRLGALNIIKGYNYGGIYRFNPDSKVSNQEVIAALMRALGQEGNAQIEAERLAKQDGIKTDTLDLWYRGFFVIANRQGLITQQQLEDALIIQQDELDPKYCFMRKNPVTREQLADWIVTAIYNYNPQMLSAKRPQQTIYKYKDWQKISTEKIPACEAVLVHNIMEGFEDNTFRPQSYITRKDLIKILKNIDSIYYGTQNIERKNGIVAAIQDNINLSAGDNNYKRTLKIRNENGQIEEITYEYTKDTIEQVVDKDVVVFKDGRVQGLMSLKENDSIEYLVNEFDEIMLYVYDKGVTKSNEVDGILKPLTQIEEGYITLRDGKGNTNTFKLIKGLYGKKTKLNGDLANYILIDGKVVEANQAPVDNWIKLKLKNNIVMEIQYVGQPKMYSELRGMVIENSPLYGYLTVLDSSGNKITKHYYKDQVKVEKQQYYDQEDEVGYYDEVFPSFKFDPMDTSVNDIEVGDVVYLGLDSDNKDYILRISAKPNYTMYYGKVENINQKGLKGAQVQLLFEDGRRTMLNVSNDVPIMKDGRKISTMYLVPGDWVKVLVNLAVIGPGQEKLTVKEIVVDNNDSEITNIYRGQLSYINTTQNLVYLKDAQSLTKMGWTDYKQSKILNLFSGDVEFYENDKRISKDYANHFLRYTGNVYVAMENKYGSEQVKKVVFRNDRDTVLKSSNVIYSNGAGNIRISGQKNRIKVDPGTIIVRNGRLVNAQNIMVPDYAKVVLNGNQQAAVVSITKAPTIEDIQVYRARIASINDGSSFKVQSHARLKGMDWQYSPVQNRFIFDYTTKLLDETGNVDINSFIDYSKESKVDKVYTIFTKGNDAKIISDSPYVTEGVKGELYNIEEGKLSLRYSSYYDRQHDCWYDFSYKNRGVIVDLPKNAVIIKNGDFISIDELERGDKLRVMTDENLIDKSIKLGLNDIKGYIILVEG